MAMDTEVLDKLPDSALRMLDRISPKRLRNNMEKSFLLALEHDVTFKFHLRRLFSSERTATGTAFYIVEIRDDSDCPDALSDSHLFGWQLCKPLDRLHGSEGLDKQSIMILKAIMKALCIRCGYTAGNPDAMHKIFLQYLEKGLLLAAQDIRPQDISITDNAFTNPLTLVNVRGAGQSTRINLYQEHSYAQGMLSTRAKVQSIVQDSMKYLWPVFVEYLQSLCVQGTLAKILIGAVGRDRPVYAQFKSGRGNEIRVTTSVEEGSSEVSFREIGKIEFGLLFGFVNGSLVPGQQLHSLVAACLILLEGPGGSSANIDMDFKQVLKQAVQITYKRLRKNEDVRLLAEDMDIKLPVSKVCFPTYDSRCMQST